MASLPKRGRPKLDSQLHRIGLRTDVYNEWLTYKEFAGMREKTHSEFASYLLQIMEETRHQNLHISRPSHDLESLAASPVMHSTPVQPTIARRTLRLEDDSLSVIVDDHEISEHDIDRNVHVSGVSSSCLSLQLGDPLHVSRIESLCTTINPEFGMYSDDPSSESESETSESSETGSDSRSSESELYDEIVSEDDEGNGSVDDDNDDGVDDDHDDNDGSCMEIANQISEDADATLSASECEGQGEEDMDVTDTEVVSIEIQHGPETRKDCTDRLKKKLKVEFDKVNQSGKESNMFKDHVQQSRAIVNVNLLLELFQNNCQNKSCAGKCMVIDWKVNGGVLKVSWKCSIGHTGCWSSSKVLCQKKEQKVYSNTILIAAGIIITGNNFEKFSLFCKFLGLATISRSTFMRVQKRYVIPMIERFWNYMKAIVWKVFEGESIVLCGDGRNDSPGHSAKYYVYVMMEQFVDVIVDLVVVDKRETGGVSTNMEVYGLKKLLERIVGEIVVSEIVTDASSAVIALVRKMKEKYPKEFSHLFHALDIWHKSVKLTKKLSKAAKVKGCEVISEWAEPIRNHFWYIAQESNGNVEKLKDNWFGVLHHVVGEHEWAEGECNHGPLVATEADKTCLEKNSKAMEGLRKVVTDPRFVKSLHHYVTFRHTSKIENFNSMLLKYAPKQVGFQNESFMARSLLAGIDHNCHIFRQAALSKSGKVKYNKVYSKRSKNWRANTVLEEKTYDFWAQLSTNVLQKRVDDKDSILTKNEVPAEHPKKIAPSIAMKPIPSTEDIVKQSLSRFSNASSQAEPVGSEPHLPSHAEEGFS